MSVPVFTKRVPSLEVGKIEFCSLELLRKYVAKSGADILVPKPLEVVPYGSSAGGVGMDGRVADGAYADGTGAHGALFRMERIDDRGTPKPYLFGRELAMLHQYAGTFYGLDSNNTIGASPQINTPSSRWVNFFRSCRLEPQLRWALQAGLLPGDCATQIESLIQDLDSYLEEPEHPSFLHGDLWGGNHLYPAEGGVALIDPAPYWGDPLADIAMTYLFGGFSPDFYQGYQEIRPFPQVGESRDTKVFAIYNLYHALNHLNIFGASYLSMVEGVLWSIST